MPMHPFEGGRMCPQVRILQQLNPSIAGHSSRGCKCEGSSSSIEQPLKCLNLFVAIGLRIIYSLRIIWWMSRGVGQGYARRRGIVHRRDDRDQAVIIGAELAVRPGRADDVAVIRNVLRPRDVEGPV